MKECNREQLMVSSKYAKLVKLDDMEKRKPTKTTFRSSTVNNNEHGRRQALVKSKLTKNC